MDKISKDDRFNKISKDPRFKTMPKKERKVKIDKRFKDMFSNKKFKLKYSVDKRGRPVQSTTNENFRKYYDISDSEDDGDDEKKDEVKEEDEQEKIPQSKDRDSDDEDDDVSESEESGLGSGPDLARGEGNVETSSEEEEESDEEIEDDDDDCLVQSMADLDKDAVETSEITSRLAICNMDWDRVKAQDIFVLLESFKPTSGVIKSVKIYPSEFGIQRMKLEEMKGPIELTKTPILNDTDHNAEDPEGASFHTEKVRKYQLNRLKYYYAVVECDSANTANAIYEECDNMEYESSANRLDLRFIPDDMTFDHPPKAECTELPASYKPSLFFTTALCQSKVDLTWDETDYNRLKVTMNPALGKRSRKARAEIKEEDFKAYLASSSDEEDAAHLGDLNLDLGDEDSESEDEQTQINKYKELVKSLKETEDQKKNKDVVMEITWEPGLKESTEKIVKKKKKEKDMTVWDKYLEKKKEKKSKKREEKDKSPVMEQNDSESDDQAFSDDDVPDDIKADPFFQHSDEEQKPTKKKKKGKKKGKKEETQEDRELKEKTEAELSLLMMDEENKEGGKRHFNLKNLVEEESSKKKKKKKMKKRAAEKEEPEDDFKVNVTDPRFEALYTSHMYNIDPSAPEYKKTKGMKDISDAKQKFRKLPNDLKRKSLQTEDSQPTSKTVKLNSDGVHVKDTSLQRLVESVKTKTKQFKNKK